MCTEDLENKTERELKIYSVHDPANEDDQGSLCQVARTSLSSCNKGSWLFSRQPVTARSSLSPWKPAGCSVMWPPRNSQLRARCGYSQRRRPRHGDTRGVNPPGVRDPATVSLPGRRVPSEPSSDLGSPACSPLGCSVARRPVVCLVCLVSPDLEAATAAPGFSDARFTS